MLNGYCIIRRILTDFSTAIRNQQNNSELNKDSGVGETGELWDKKHIFASVHSTVWV